MRSARQNNQIVRFGAYEADLRNLELRKLGMRISFQGQPFRILEMLLRHQGKIVSREELRNALWSDDTFVEFDHGINTAMQKIRGALHDSVSNPRFVETLPRRGYRFIAPVQFVNGPTSRQDPTRAIRGKSLTMARLAGLVEKGMSFLKRSQV